MPDTNDEIVIQKVSVSEVAEVRDQLKQLVRIGMVIMLVIVGVQLWGLKQQLDQNSCAHDTAEALTKRAEFNNELDDITTKKFELDQALTNQQLPLAQYNKEMNKLITQREHAVAERDSTRFPPLDKCK